MEIKNSDIVVMGVATLFAIIVLIGRNPKMKNITNGSFSASSNINMFKVAILGTLSLIAYIVTRCS